MPAAGAGFNNGSRNALRLRAVFAIPADKCSGRE
jgi:hypothetical protein